MSSAIAVAELSDERDGRLLDIDKHLAAHAGDARGRFLDRLVEEGAVAYHR